MQACTGARARVCYRHSRWTWAGGRASFAIEQWYYTVAVCRSIRNRAGRVEQAAIGAWRAQDVSGGVEPQHTVQHAANSGQGQGRMGRWCRACLVVKVKVKVKVRMRRRVAGRPGGRARVVRGQRVPRASEVDGVVAEERGGAAWLSRRVHTTWTTPM